MTNRRQAFRSALLVTCSTFLLTASSPLGFCQNPPPVDNPATATARADEQQEDSDDQTERRQGARERAADRDGAGDDRRRAPDDEAGDLAQPRIWLGIGLKEVSGDLAAYLGSSKGVLVESVFPDSPAEAAGIQVGDIIIALNGERVADPRAFIEGLLKLDDSKPPKARQDKERQRNDAERKEDAQRKEDAEEKADAEQKEARIDNQQKSQRDDDQQSDRAKKRAAYPPVKLTLMRQGKEITVELAPTERPESLKMPSAKVELSLDGEIAGLQQMLEKMESQGGTRVFRFGPPSTLQERRVLPAEKRIENLVIVVKDASGEATEVRIERVGDEPAKITVREGDKSREITADQIDQLPEKVRDAVRKALQQQEQARAAAESRGEAARQKAEAEVRQRMEQAQRNMQGNERQRLEAMQRWREQFRQQPEGPTTFLSPDQLREMGRAAEELATKYQKLAEEMAKRGVQKAQDWATVPDELKELRTQVDELKKQVEELRAQAKASKQ